MRSLLIIVAFVFWAIILRPANADAACNVSLAKTYYARGQHYDKLQQYESAAQAYMFEANLLNDCSSPANLMTSATGMAFAGSSLLLAGRRSTGIAEIRLGQLMLSGIMSLHPESAAQASRLYDIFQKMIDD